MVVGRSTFANVIDDLCKRDRLSLDCETTGLRPHHGDKLFSIIIADSETEYYFNWNAYTNLDPELILTNHHLQGMQKLFQIPTTLWYLHNAKFDMAMLDQEGLHLDGTIHCTMAQGRVEYNEHFKYTLDASLERIGLKKDDAVSRYITEHNLYEKKEIPGKKTVETVKHYDRVPFEIIEPYGCTDARGTFLLGQSQEESIAKQASSQPTGLPTVQTIKDNERRLTKTVFAMEKIGVRIDKEYTLRAASFERDRADKAMCQFKRVCGQDYKASSKMFAVIFESERDKWEYTEKGNPSFETDILKKFENPAAKIILELRDAKSKADFYNGFLYHADTRGDIHPNYNPHGAAHGRFSSSNPNFQNLTSEDITKCTLCGLGFDVRPSQCSCGSEKFHEIEFVTRRSIIPRPGFIFIMPDWSAMEYRLMFELANRLVLFQPEAIQEQLYKLTKEGTPLVQKINSGVDPHQSTADLVSSLGTPLTRSRAKNGNFALLYGAGDTQLAYTIGGTVEEAKSLRKSIFSVAPEIQLFIRSVVRTAQDRKFVFNWMGRKCHFPNREFAYIAPNYLIAGGCADIVKLAMNRIHDMQIETGCKSRMVMNVHDELDCETSIDEISWYPKKVLEIMENSFESKFLPLTCTMEWSEKSLADKRKGFPNA